MKSHVRKVSDGLETCVFLSASREFWAFCEWHLCCLSVCVIQRCQPEDVAPLEGQPCVSDSLTSIGSQIVRAETGAGDDGLSVFLSMRARLCAIAYRILKSAAEAEDIVQDVWIRWQTTDRGGVRDAAAFLVTTTTHLAINVIQSARWRRETTIGPSLWESVDTSDDPESEAERSEGLQGAVLVLLEKLSPAERAAYALREAFDYSYREIANILRVQEANARQLVTRARQHLVDSRHAVVNSVEQKCFLAAFVAAAHNGAFAALESFFVGARGSPGKDERERRTGTTIVESLRDSPSWPALDTAVAA